MKKVFSTPKGSKDFYSLSLAEWIEAIQSHKSFSIKKEEIFFKWLISPKKINKVYGQLMNLIEAAGLAGGQEKAIKKQISNCLFNLTDGEEALDEAIIYDLHEVGVPFCVFLTREDVKEIDEDNPNEKFEEIK